MLSHSNFRKIGFGGYNMTFPVHIESSDGQFAASLIGEPKVRVVGQTRLQAVDALKLEIEQRIAAGELVALEIDILGITSLAGKYANDVTLRGICDDAYQNRDANRD